MSQRHTLHTAGLGAMAGLCLLATACGSGSAAAPAPAGPATTAAPPVASAAAASAPSPAAPAPTPLVAPSQIAAAPAASPARAPSASAVPSVAAAAPASSSVRLVVDSAASQASYHAREQLVGNTLPTEAVGTTPGVSGTLAFDADGLIPGDPSTITVDLSQLKSNESRRDNYIKNNTLETNRYPTATFVARSVQGLSTPLPSSGTATFQLLGDLTVHDVTRPVTWQVSAQFADTAVNGSATTSVNISDFGMTPPKVGPVLSIEDGLNLDLAFTANRAS